MLTSNSNSCLVVAVEGPDCLGKTTQVALIKQALISQGYKTTTEKIPYDDGITHSEIYRMLKDGTVNLDPVVLQVLHTVNRRYFQRHILPSLLEDFEVIILDRWNLSTRVYGAASGVSFAVTENLLKGIIEPDLVVVLDGSPFLRKDLDAWESDEKLQQAVRDGYCRWCEQNPSQYIKVEANRSKEEVHRQILDLLLAHLSVR